MYNIRIQSWVIIYLYACLCLSQITGHVGKRVRSSVATVSSFGVVGQDERPLGTLESTLEQLVEGKPLCPGCPHDNDGGFWRDSFMPTDLIDEPIFGIAKNIKAKHIKGNCKNTNGR